jgi:hypothetical protein
MLLAILGTTTFDSRAALITWTLQNVTFADGGTASGFVTFDPSAPHTPGFANYLTNFDIKTTAGTVFTAPFEYTPANTDAYVPYYVSFFSAPESSSPRHGLPQHTLRLKAQGEFPTMGGRVEILVDASEEKFVGEDFPSDDSLLFRSISGGSLVGVLVPEPATPAFVGIGLALLGLSYRRQARWR